MDPEKLDVLRSLTEKLAAYPTAVIEDVLRERIARHMAELRRHHPELFDEDGGGLVAG